MKTKPATPEEINASLYRKPGKSRLDTETQITKGCLDWLNTVPGVQCWRQNTGGREWIDTNGRKRYVQFGEPGQADITGIGPGGIRIEIEVKRPGEEPNLLQMTWLAMIVRRGGIGFWCDSLNSCMRMLSSHFRQIGLDWQKRWEI